MQVEEINLPPISTETDFTDFSFATKDLDFIALSFEYQRHYRKEEYAEAADALTKMLAIPVTELDEEFYRNAEIRGKRAECYALMGEYQLADQDLDWISHNTTLTTEQKIDVARGILQQMQGKESTYLQKAASRGDALALLLLNEPENTSPSPTSWKQLSVEDRIEKLLAGRYYAEVIEEINAMAPSERKWWEPTIDSKWLAVRASCYALRGNYKQAVLDFEQANKQSFYAKYNHEEAIIYARVGQKEDALKLINQSHCYFCDASAELINRLIQLQIEKN